MRGIGVLVLATITVAPAHGRQSTQQVLQRFVDDYARDPMIQEATFGVEIDGETFTIAAHPAREGMPAQATLMSGRPTIATWMWLTDRATLDRIASGALSASTAQGKASNADRTPMRDMAINGFEADAAFYQNVFRTVNFHFWTVGQPEIVRLGIDHARRVHGGHAVPGVYASGVRTAWYAVAPGDHINADPASQTDPWTTAFFVVKGGTGKARIGDKVIALESDTMVLVPPGIRHEFWNKGTVAAEMIMVTFGKGS